jgi:hypothetical protein
MLKQRKKWLIAALFSCALAFSAQAQESIDLSSYVYQRIDEWALAGLVKYQPVMRPYSVQLIVSMANEVIADERATEAQKKDARRVMSDLTAGFIAGVGEETRTTSDGVTFNEGKFKAGYSGMLADALSLAGRINAWAVDGADGYALPYIERPSEDFITDNTSFNLGGKTIAVRQMGYALLAYGKADKSFSAQAGFTKNSVGPFYDNGVVIGPNTAGAGTFSYLYKNKLFDYQSAFLIYSDSTGANSNINTTGMGLTSDKYLNFHSLRFFPFSFLDLGVMEAVISEGGIEPLYFLPVSSYFQTQGLSTFSGNSLLGLDFAYRPARGASVNGTLFVDDADFNNLVKLQFDCKWKFAAQIGASANLPSLLRIDNAWLNAFPLLKADYTAVMPYTYTHVNNSVYSAWGYNIGPELDPNSDRIRLSVTVLPLVTLGDKTLQADFDLRFTRHGNASAGITGGDGSLFDPGFDSNGIPTFESTYVDPTGQPHTRFLTQSVIEKTLDMGCKLSYELGPQWRPEGTRSWGKVTVYGGYTFEYQLNAGLVSGATKTTHYLDIGFDYSY